MTAPQQRRWYVIETKPWQEAIAVEHLQRQGFEILYPTVWKKKRYRGEDIEFAAAQFSGYLFVTFDIRLDPWQRINGTRGVKRILSLSGGSPSSIEPEIAEFLLLKYRDGPIRDPASVMRDLTNEVVRITNGAFEGHTGIVQWHDSTCVKLLLHVFGRSNIVKLETSQIVPQ